jgi:hypothetical protein
MTIRRPRRAAIVVALCSAVPVFAAPAKDLPVTSIFSEYAADIAPSLQIQSDQAGAYVNSKSLSSVIQPIGAWEMDASSSTRSVYLGFTQPIPGSGPGGGAPVAVPSDRYHVRAISKCNANGYNMLTLAAGATITCPLHLAFTYNGTSYAVQMNPGVSPNGVFPETNYANVTCIFPTSGSNPCSQWKLTPSGTYTAADGTLKYRNVGVLLKYSSYHGQTIAEVQGDFYFSFQILATNP